MKRKTREKNTLQGKTYWGYKKTKHMKSYKKTKMSELRIIRNTSEKGEPLEAKIRRMLQNKEPVGDTTPLIYSEREDGVQPDYNPRTDKWEYAVDATTKLDASNKARREQSRGEKTYDTMTPEQQKEFNAKFPNNKHNKQSNSGAEPIAGTDSTK